MTTQAISPTRDPEPEERPRLAPLRCDNCGATVPLGEKPTASCRHCASVKAIPQEYLDLRDAARLRVEDQSRVQACYRRLCEPQSWFVRMWMDASTAVVMALTVTLAFTGIVAIVIGLWTPGFITAKMEVASIYSLFSIPAMFGWALHGAARSIGFDVIDLTGAWVSYLGLGFFFYISLAVPGALGTFADAFAAVRATLRKLLSVVSDKAGHGECRVCGAALDLPPGALGARCVYCQADNLVAPTEAEARKARDGAAKGHHQVDEAMAEEGRVRAAALSNLRSSILVRAVLLPTFMLAGLTLQWGIEGHTSPFWRRASLPTRALAPTYSSPIPRDQEVRLDAFTFDNCYEGDNLCQATILVGLEKGDRIFLHGFDAPLKISMTQRRPSRWWELSWKWEPMPLGDPAPYSGWYRLRIESPRKGKWQPITVRWSVAR